MTGVVGTVGEPGAVGDLLSEMYQEPWYVKESLGGDDTGLGALHHGRRDPTGHTTWADGTRAGVVHGVITNRTDSGLSDADLFRSLLSDPGDVLRGLEGSFLIAAVDTASDRAVVATDKLGTRPCYYVSSGPAGFGSSVAPLLQLVEDPRIDERGVSDMTMIGHVWGGKTLVRQIKFLRSGSYLELDEGGHEVSSYWEHNFEQIGRDEFVAGVSDVYHSAVERMAGTLDGEAGLWLSGGLDSRAMAVELNRTLDSLETFTYDANPANGSNLKLATEVADTLGIANHQVELSADTFVDVLDRCVSLTDGMLGLVTFANLSAAFNIPAETRPGVIIEACGQGGMMGDGIGQATIKRSDSPEEALYRAKHKTDRNLARRLLETDFDPMETYRREVRASDQSDFYGTVMDCYYRNYFPRCDFASNPVARSQAGTRVPFADTEFLSYITKMPLELRTRSIPLTRGKIPYATTEVKLELMRELDGELDSIPYERTRVAPSRPLVEHAVGFVVTTSIDRLLSRQTYGGRGLVGEWYRRNYEFRDRINTLLADACDRPFYDGDEIERLRDEHLDGEENHMGTISGIATVELWLQRHFPS